MNRLITQFEFIEGVKKITSKMNHLEYYQQHNILPVHYKGTREEHFQRRESLYRALRMPPLLFQYAKILEIAAGTGQNAEYIYSLIFNEKNFVAIDPMLHDSSKKSLVHEISVEDYFARYPYETYDIIICENWLGRNDSEILKKIAARIRNRGILVITCVPALGVLPNMLRRGLATQLINDNMTFEEKTQILVQAFSSHLDTIKDMTRSHKDWVQDTLLYPDYDKMIFEPAEVFNQLPDFEILGSSPDFVSDWRWFKSLYGDNRKFNEHFISHYSENSLRFMSYKDNNEFLVKEAINEAQELLATKDKITVEAVANMSKFKYLFGRETLYLGLQKK